MTENDAFEQAYRNGYEAGYKAGLAAAGKCTIVGYDLAKCTDCTGDLNISKSAEVKDKEE